MNLQQLVTKLVVFRTNNKSINENDCSYSFGIFENGVLLMYTLEGVNSVVNVITAYEESQ